MDLIRSLPLLDDRDTLILRFPALSSEVLANLRTERQDKLQILSSISGEIRGPVGVIERCNPRTI